MPLLINAEIKMKAVKLLSAILLAAITLAGCDSDNDVAIANFRVLHAVPDAPAVNVLIDGDVALEGVDYKSGTGFLSDVAGTYSVQVDALVPGGIATVIGPADVPLAVNTETSIIAIGKVASNSIEPFIHSRAVSLVPAGSARAEVLHGAPDAPPVDVYVTAPGADLNASAKLGDTTIAFKQSIGPAEVPAGIYQVRVTLEDQPGAVVFDAGEVELTDGADLLIVAVERTGAGSAPISLLVWDQDGVAELLDASTPANLRVVHASPDTPAVDVVVNGNFMMPLVPGITYPNVVPQTGYASVDAGAYDVVVTDSATQGLMPIMAQLTFGPGTETTVVAVDFLSNVRALLLDDDNRRLATAAKVRIVHGSPSAGSVDIYVTAPGTLIDDVDPDFSGVALEQSTGYVELAAGSYVVTVTGAGSKAPAIGPLPITVAAGGVHTVIARDDGAGFNIIGLDDPL